MIANDTPLRLRLRVISKLMGLSLVLALVWVFARSLFSAEEASSEELTVALLNSQIGEQHWFEWQGRHVVVIHRDTALLANLQEVEPFLLDPQSQAAIQPPGLENSSRARQAEFLILIAHDTATHCVIEYHPKSARGPQGLPWYGGFKDSCRDTWYDLSGRVYRGQLAQRNLDIPPHYYPQQKTLRIGSNGSN